MMAIPRCGACDELIFAAEYTGKDLDLTSCLEFQRLCLQPHLYPTYCHYLLNFKVLEKEKLLEKNRIKGIW